MPRGEIHVELVVDYAEDDKLAEVSRSARLLWVDALLLAKRLLSDGLVTQQQVLRLAFPEPAKVTHKLVSELVESGGFVRVDRGYLVSGFLKRNKSKATVIAERKAAQDAADKGNHQRWHGEKASPKCRYCIADSSEPLSGTRSPSRSGQAKREGSPETETETETSMSEPEVREDVEAICQHLADRINEHVTKPVRIIESWRTAARRLLDVDKRPVDEVFRVIDWCQADSFWQPNILSMPKLRDKYETLRLRSQQKVTQLRPVVGNGVYDDDEEVWMR